MPVDTTILDLIKAGNYATAIDALKAGWPTAFLDTTVAALEQAAGSRTATSGSSVTVGTGSKVFVLDSPGGWPDGTPVYIMADSDPTGVVLGGFLDGAETPEGVATVTVEWVRGSGTYSAWTILSLFSTVAAAGSPPYGEAVGGLGADTFAQGRVNLGVMRTVSVIAVQAAPPVGASLGDVYGVLQAATGAWAGHDGEWATEAGGSWTFETPLAGELTYAEDTSRTWKAIGPGAWTLFAREEAAPFPWGTLTSTTTLSATHFSGTDVVILLDSTGGSFTVTLPLVGVLGRVCLLRLCNFGSANSVTVNVASAGTISGATSKSVAAGASLSVLAYYTASPAVARWVVA